LLERENLLPPWRELLYVYRRLEARGEIRGGRFVDGFSGEQFALPDAAGALRKFIDADDEQPCVISAADPLNLTGIILPGERISSQSVNRILFHNGVPLAIQTGRDIRFLGELSNEEQWAARTRLAKRANPAGFSAGTHFRQ
jgi:ATP-dependent Lhr-like helicase